MDKVIISAALTGAITPKEITPFVPYTPEEIANDAYECYKAGAAIVHLHMRDEKGHGTMDKALFKKTTDLIKEKCDIVMNLTTSGDAHAGSEERMAHLIELKPEMASFDAGSFNWMPIDVFMNSPQFLEKLSRVMFEHDIKPEIEIFDSGMIHNASYYIKKGLIKTPAHYRSFSVFSARPVQRLTIWCILRTSCPRTPHGPLSVSAKPISLSCMRPLHWAAMFVWVWRIIYITIKTSWPQTLNWLKELQE